MWIEVSADSGKGKGDGDLKKRRRARYLILGTLPALCELARSCRVRRVRRCRDRMWRVQTGPPGSEFCTCRLCSCPANAASGLLSTVSADCSVRKAWLLSTWWNAAAQARELCTVALRRNAVL